MDIASYELINYGCKSSTLIAVVFLIISPKTKLSFILFRYPENASVEIFGQKIVTHCYNHIHEI